VSAPRRNKRPISGWLVLDKPYGMTSTEAVAKVRWLFQAEKAGHAGTLDPLATGILPIALGEATKTVPMVQDGTKTYLFTVKWGEATSTDDREGAVIATSPVRPEREAILAVLPQFTGTISQRPPAFSAIKVAGERAYDLARAGETVELAERLITIDSLTLTASDAETATFEAICQKGTYVRSLARDMALALGTQGHVIALRRSAVGGFTQADCVTIDTIEPLELPGRDALLNPIASGLQDLPEIRLDPRQAGMVRQGNGVLLIGANAPIALENCWASSRGEAVAIGMVENGQFKPRRVLLGTGGAV